MAQNDALRFSGYDTEHELDEDVQEELGAAARMIQDLLPEYTVFVVTSPDLVITDRRQYATGTQIWTFKTKAQLGLTPPPKEA